MLYPRSKKFFIHVKAVILFLFSFFIINAKAQNDAVLIVKGQTVLKSRAQGLGLNSGVKSVDYKEESMEGVDIEVKKNGSTILSIKSGKKGKYSFEIPVSTSDLKNDYVVYFTREGAGPRMVNVNAFIPKEESGKYSAPKYECELEVPLYGTSVKDIPSDKAFAKIKWDKVKEHKFTLDDVYTKSYLADERKIMAGPDAYYTALVKKKSKQDEALAKNNAAAEAKLKAAEEAKKKAAEEEAQKLAKIKAEEEAKRKAIEEAARLAKLKGDEEARKKAEAESLRLAKLKAKEDAERLAREKEEALKNEKLRKHIADSIAAAEKNKPSPPVVANKPDIKDILREIKDPYDASATYSINIARKAMKMEKERRNKEKGKNLSAKYESFNILTSLLNEVDDYDKRNKTQ